MTEQVKALVVTTVKVPSALEYYRDIERAAPFYVVGDEQAPDREIRAFCDRIDATYLSAADQRKLGYACSGLLRWRDPARRSVGCLEAARDGAGVVIVADDDNLPLDGRYFADHAAALDGPFTGLTLEGRAGWADPWALLAPRVRHRGFPLQLWDPPRPASLGWACGLRPGVNAGMVLGDPDIDATERITSHPAVMGASAVADAGVALRPGTYAPFNQQDIAFRRELLPVMCMLSPAGRPADIWCAYLAERVMAVTGWCVRYGRPYVWQERNEHDLAEDVALEVRGYRETLAFAAALGEAVIPAGADVTGAARAVHEHLARTSWADVAALGLAWLEDCEAVL